jgi:hypothetical protein
MKAMVIKEVIDEDEALVALALAGLVTGILATGEFTLPRQASAQPTQAETKRKAVAKWNSMPPEQQQQAMAKGKSAAQKAQKK